MASYMLNAGTSCCTACRPSPCDPCTPATYCCLYPPPTADPDGDIIPPQYPATDLPETLEVVYPDGSVYDTYTRGDGYNYTGTITEGGSNGLGAELSFGDWHAFVTDPDKGTGGDYYNGNCLTGGYGLPAGLKIRDTFHDTYTVNGTDLLTRQGGCTWTGPKSGGGTWKMEYGVSTPFAWSLNGTAKVAPQSSPAGSYGAGNVA